MSKTRNKKRLTALVLVFALVFVAGSAFAFTNGVLDIVGTVNISEPTELYVVWQTANAYSELYATHTARIEDRDGPPDLNRTGQRIFWDITFDGYAAADGSFTGAMVLLSATARNASLQDAYISNVTVRWIAYSVTIDDDELVPDGVDTFDPADFGIRYDIFSDNFTGVLRAGQTTAANSELIITVNWDGHSYLPDGFWDGVADGALELVGTLVIEFDYELYNPGP